MKSVTNKGITLIALVITIIVLLILAGVSIATLTGQNGVLIKASTAQKDTEIENAKEQAKIDIANWIADKLENEEKAELNDSIIKIIITGKNYVSTEEGQPGDNSFKTKENGYEIPYSDLYNKTTGSNPTLPTTADTKPYLPDDNTKVISNNPETGIIIQDSKKNEWVWIEVPKSIYTNTEYNGGTVPSSSEDYDKIESVMQAYATTYRKNGLTDTWYSKDQHGLEEQEYNELKQSMLKSVYENGGFYIGRYEVGTDTARAAKTDPLTTPVIQRDKYPYNYVTCSQAQERVSTQLKVGNKTSSLMFGIQWDLVMKFIEEKGYLQDGTKVSKDMLKSNSEAWGNYNDVSFDVKREQASYTTLPDTKNSWNSATNYIKQKSAVVLTTGSVDRNSVLGIYDLAGNVYEWTLEYTASEYSLCSSRGGVYVNSSSGNPVAIHGYYGVTNSESYNGFRPALW